MELLTVATAISRQLSGSRECMLSPLAVVAVVTAAAAWLQAKLVLCY